MKPNPSLPTPPSPTSTVPSDWVIRANQGHSIASIDSAALLVPITLSANNVPETVVHGTYYGNYQAILDTGGLKKMSRNHVHFSTGLPEDGKGVVSGMRNDAELLIYIDIHRSLSDGVLWWLSENGVVLTEGDENGLVKTEYWKKVEGRRQNVGVLWEDGVEVAELPQSVSGRKVPSGKGPRGRREGEKSKVRDVAKGRGRGKDMKELDALDEQESLGLAEP
jgi:2'-phosphotransferase